MNIDLEIRKLPLKERNTLIKCLEEQESWKKLMSIIPQVLQPKNYNCDITVHNPAKYKSDHFHIAQNASKRDNLLCAEILLREWGTSGRVRPTLGHLKYLLEKAQLFNAAEFIAVDVLKREPPLRPSKGPGAPICFDDELDDSEIRRVEKLLDEINYPSSAIENICQQNSVDTNINYTAKEVSKEIPKIVISESPDTEELKPSFIIPLVIQSYKDNTHSDNNTKSDSDLMKFSESSNKESNDPNVPNFSLLDSSSSTQSVPVVENSSDSSECVSTDNNIPNLSALSMPSDSLSNVPAISDLLDSKSRSCISPLPNLSLNTRLPHFAYAELESATDCFNETALAEGGKLLGAGSFGKVYLAHKLFNQPVAVKKLILDNEEVVKVDDRITKQFKTEVEILSKYKHENLVTLLGYSCDGLTYCLVYEYVPGGSLTDKLEKQGLIWTERLYVAFGTAKAIVYLHTEFDTPLIHRDVKSANILLDVTNKPKLCDFGLIKHCMSQNTHTATTIIGTSAYMSPEAFRGDISMKMDTYSFGVVLLELLTSKPPIDENREGRDLVTHVEEFCKAGEIQPLLDTSVGSWTANDINLGQKLYEVAQDCLREKKQQRPTMTSVFSSLNELIQKGI